MIITDRGYVFNPYKNEIEAKEKVNDTVTSFIMSIKSFNPVNFQIELYVPDR